MQVRSPSQPLTHSYSQTLMQPAMSNFFTLNVSPQILFALTSSPHTFVAVAELVRTSGTTLVSTVEPTVAVPTPPWTVPKGGVPAPGSKMPQSYKCGQGHEEQSSGGQPQGFGLGMIFVAGLATSAAAELLMS